MTEFRSPLQAQIVQWFVAPGDTVRTGDVLVILEAMKMEHEVRATDDGRVTELLFAAGDTVNEGELLLISERVTTDSRWDGAEKIKNSGPEDVSRASAIRRGACRPCAPICSGSLTAMRSRSMRAAPRRSPNAMRWASARRARTSPTCVMKAVSSNTARWPWPPSAAAAAKTT
jgi:pyruvate/2-oxoglutarate dehydrogenase complex dihydrolipoamide acyltransferase (E2) component